MKDLGQEALDEMNRLLLNQKHLKTKLEKMGNYGESATIKNQIADLSKKVERLQEQLNEANRVIKRELRRQSPKGGVLLGDMNDYLEKWGVK